MNNARTKRLQIVTVFLVSLQCLASFAKDNEAPPGFYCLFNGRTLEGWKGLVADPPHRASMTSGELAEAQSEADSRMRAHWKVIDGVLQFDGLGDNLCTDRDYGDFELWVDWKIEPSGDSGIYLRGSPQVQIWDPTGPEEAIAGSGGLYNNEKGPNGPLAKVDKPVGEWNKCRIVMISDKVFVWLNQRLVVDGVTLENYWERDKPIYTIGPIELQSHQTKLQFKNIYLREL